MMSCANNRAAAWDGQWRVLVVAMLVLGPAVLQAAPNLGYNNNYAEDEPWIESEVPAPPAFSDRELVTFDVSTGSPLVYGVDPASLQISEKDGLVRYVMVATSSSGARSVLYEGIRCATGEVKTYARFSSDGKWVAATNPQWVSMFGNLPSKHALRFAQAGGCDNASIPRSVSSLVSRLKTGSTRIYN